MLSRHPTHKITTLGTLMDMELFTHEAYKSKYVEDKDFKEIFQLFQRQHHEEGNNDAN